MDPFVLDVKNIMLDVQSGQEETFRIPHSRRHDEIYLPSLRTWMVKRMSKTEQLSLFFARECRSKGTMLPQ